MGIINMCVASAVKSESTTDLEHGDSLRTDEKYGEGEHRIVRSYQRNMVAWAGEHGAALAARAAHAPDKTEQLRASLESVGSYASDMTLGTQPAGLELTRLELTLISLLPFLLALVGAFSVWHIPSYQGGHTHFWVVEFLFYTLWCAAVNVAGVTNLDSVSPVQPGKFIYLVWIFATACVPLFWFVRAAKDGDWYFKEGFGEGVKSWAATSCVYDFLVVLPIFPISAMWMICGYYYNAQDPHNPVANTGVSGSFQALNAITEDAAATPTASFCSASEVEENMEEETIVSNDPEHSWYRQAGLSLGVLVFKILLYVVTTLYWNYGADRYLWSTYAQNAWVVGFWAVIFILRTFSNRLGMMADSHKRGTFSVYLALHFAIGVQYFTMNREILVQITVVSSDSRAQSASLFVFMQFVTIGFQWLELCVMGSKRYFDMAESWKKYYEGSVKEDSGCCSSCCCCCCSCSSMQTTDGVEHSGFRACIFRSVRCSGMYLLLPEPAVKTHDDMVSLLCLEAALQFVTSVFTGLFFFGLVVLRFKTPWSHDSYIDHQYTSTFIGGDENSAITLQYLATSLGLEVVNLILLECVYFRRRGYSVCLALYTLMQQRRFGVNCFGECMTVAFNIIYSMLKFNDTARF